MWRIMQHPEPDDFVLLLDSLPPQGLYTESLAVAGIFLKWEGSGASEIGRDTESGSVWVRIDPAYRPTEGISFLGMPARPEKSLVGSPT